MTPTLFLLAGPNGSGKSTYVERYIQPVTGLKFVNADVIAKELWPDPKQAEQNAREAAKIAEARRDELMAVRESFITETVFSHISKLELVKKASAIGYRVELYSMLVPVDVAVGRVHDRVTEGGHSVPEAKTRERYARLWALVAAAAKIAHATYFFDNSEPDEPFREVAELQNGLLVGKPDWPKWAPAELKGLS